MKKETLIGVLLSVLGIAALALLAGYLTWQFGGRLLPAPGEHVESEADAVIQALQESAAEEPSEKMSESQDSEERPGSDAVLTAGSDVAASGKAKSDLTPSVIWVGDSRTLGMQKAVANSDVYIGAAGEGYNWFVETGLDEMRTAIKEHPESVVVFNFGVNDYDNLDNYISLYESLFEEYPDTRFYFLSVNPIDPEQCHNISNEEIADFNEHLRSLSPDTYLDSYTQIKAAELPTLDGIHYSQDDYRFIYNYAVGQIAKIEAAR